MIVCQCTGTTDRQVREALRCGARSDQEVSRQCGAGTVCGGCASTIQRLVRASNHNTSKTDHRAPAA